MTAHLPCAILQLRANGVIVRSDDDFLRIVGPAAPPTVGRMIGEFLTAGSHVLWESQVLPAFAVRDRIDEIFLRVRRADGDIPVLVNAAIDRDGETPLINVVMMRMQRREVWESEIHDARKRATELAETLRVRTKELEAAKQRLEESIAETASSYWMLERVADVLPLCMECGKVREGREWGSVLDYLKRNSQFLSHGYCPECARDFVEREGLAG